MHRAVAALPQQPEFLLVDGNQFKPYEGVPYACIVKGDGKYLSVAAASVLAKTHRDELMRQLSERYTGYGWEKNAGYPTALHRKGIFEQGVTPHHRQSFTLLPK